MVLGCVVLLAQQQIKYQEPPKAIKDLILAPGVPAMSMSPMKNCYITMEYTDIPTINDMAMEVHKLAGVRVLANTNAPRFNTKIHKIELKNIPGFISNAKEGIITGIPEGINIVKTIWSPNGEKILLLTEENNGIMLWIADTKLLQAKRVSNRPLNLFFGGDMIEWAPDSKCIAVAFVPSGRGNMPQMENMDIVPVIQETDGSSNPTETYQDLLKDKYSEILFDYYATSELSIISIDDMTEKQIDKKGIYSMLQFSPDGCYLLTQRIHAPYSYVVPYPYFPTTTLVMDLKKDCAYNVFEKPLVETDFINKNSTSPYPRDYGWRADVPSTLYWVEPLDGGNGRTKVAYRDRIVCSNAPFNSGSEIMKCQFRLRDISWGNDQNAFVMMYDYATRTKRLVLISPSENKVVKELYSLSNEELYGDPGRLVMCNNKNGNFVVLSSDNYKSVYMSGNGYSPEGALPFLDRLDLNTLKKSRLWRSANPYYERPVEYIDMSKGLFISQRESNYENPNYFLKNIKNPNKVKTQQLTFFDNPYESMKGVTKKQVEYTRKDGVKLSGTLYLPSGYKQGTLPLLIWAYPAEFKNKDKAEQRSDAPNQFIKYSRTSAILYVAAGYAVLNNASFPIIGEGNKEPNDTYVEQLVNNAAAAIDKMKEMGVSDGKRVAVSGHSYGAFMTANLLANCNLFAAGIARSGAYNRTLTPFGFQNEMRTLWEAPEVYLDMSPFMKADKLKAPLLLIHGLADNNTGTFPLQSERLYAALKGNGGISRLVMLPYESHGYSAKESILHQAWETYNWLEKYVKNYSK